MILHLRILGPRDQNIRLVENMEHSDRFRLPRIQGESPESNGGSNGRLRAVSASSAEDLDLLTDYNILPSVSSVPAEAQATKAKSSPATYLGGSK